MGLVIRVCLEILSLLLEQGPSILLTDLHGELVTVLIECLRRVWGGGVVLH